MVDRETELPCVSLLFESYVAALQTEHKQKRRPEHAPGQVP